MHLVLNSTGKISMMRHRGKQSCSESSAPPPVRDAPFYYESGDRTIRVGGTLLKTLKKNSKELGKVLVIAAWYNAEKALVWSLQSRTHSQASASWIPAALPHSQSWGQCTNIQFTANIRVQRRTAATVLGAAVNFPLICFWARNEVEDGVIWDNSANFTQIWEIAVVSVLGKKKSLIPAKRQSM
ncbi:hypothetical protein B0H13DRAFT_1856248 [Mycena leptocephala]|nr:hypothetical protein B0H13DRAFT_1856248 [Mycena leptocephala]